jgi:High potential iron-sulfur protein
MTTSRRTFLVRSISCVSALPALAVANAVNAQAPQALSENDPQAIALGYKADGTKADKQKYPNYTAAQNCSGCVLFQGKESDASASCAAFNNKLVTGKGWCSAWTKKA